MKPERKRLSRRDFVKTSAVSAATVGMPYVIPSGVLAMPGRLGANERVVYGCIGLGGMGENHFNYHSIGSDSHVGGICDVDGSRLNKYAATLRGNSVVTKDFRELLDRKDIDAITIATPDHWHAIMAVMACQAGKDVYSEKPTCRTVQEGQAMINAANDNKRIVQIGMQGRSHPTARQAVEFIRNGQIGKVSHVEVWHEVNHTGGWGEEIAVPSDLDYNMWVGPARWRPYNPECLHFNFRWVMDIGGGFIRDRGNHVMNVVMWAMGADKQGPVSVEATGDPNKVGVWDVPVTMEVKWEFKNPDWTMTWSQPGGQYKLPGPGGKKKEMGWGAKYHGDRDTLIVLGGDSGVETEEKAKEYTPPTDGFHAYLEPGSYFDAFLRHKANWKRCMQTREKTVACPEIAFNVVKLAIIANISFLLGRKLNWDPDNEKFIGDEEANRFLAQPYRAPWHL